MDLSVVEYNATITEVVRRAYNHTFVIPCVSIQTYSNIFTTASTGNFTWNINASLKNAKGMLFTFRDSSTQVQTLYGLSNRTSLGMLQAQLTIGSYTFPANRYLLYDCSQSIASSANGVATYPGFANFINYWMSAMKFFGQGIDKESSCSTNFDQFTRCMNNNAQQANGSFVLAFNLEGLHDSDDEFRSCIPLVEDAIV